MRIAHFTSGFPVLSETFVRDEIRSFAQSGIENLVVPLRWSHDDWHLIDESREELDLLEVIYPGLPFLKYFRSLMGNPQCFVQSVFHPFGAFTRPREWFPLGWTLHRAWEVSATLKKYNVQHCHAHFAHYPADLAFLCSRMLDCSFSFNAHSYDLYRYQATLKKKILSADGIFPVSEQNRALIVGLGRSSPDIEDRVRTIHCGLRLESYPFSDATELRRESLGTANLLGVGRLVDTKGFATLVEAVALLIRSGRPVRLDLIGEGPERPHLERLIKSLGCENQIRLHGALPHREVLTYQQKASVLVLPCCPGKNGLDGIPVVLMEAMALGTPVVSTRFAAIPELIEDRVHGRLVEPQQPEALAQAISEVLQDRLGRAQMARNARARIESQFNAASNYQTKVQLVLNLLK